MSLALMDRREEALVRVGKALEHPDMHYQAHAMAAAILALVGERDLARRELQRVRTVVPDYDTKEFFSVYAFQDDEDVRRITQAFEEIKRNS